MTKQPTKYSVIELEKGTKLPDLTGDLKEALKALPALPAFNYILMRLRMEKAVLEAYYKSSIEITDQQLRFTQIGLYWLGYIEALLKTLTKIVEKPRPANDDENKLFAQMQEAITLVK